MKLSFLLISTIFILFVNFESVAQGNKEEQLAIQYFSEEEYDKALPLLEKNFSTDAEDLFLYEYYYKSLIQLKEYRDAEKLASNVFKDHNGNISYLIDAGYASSKDGNEKQAEKYYEDAMDWLKDNAAKAPLLANAFMLRGKPEMAIQTYEKARKLESNEELYALQLARIHKKEGNI